MFPGKPQSLNVDSVEEDWICGGTWRYAIVLHQSFIPICNKVAYEGDIIITSLIFFDVISAGMAVYNAFIVCTIGVPMAIYSEKQEYEISFYVITVCIVFCTTVTLCLVFVPKVWLSFWAKSKCIYFKCIRYYLDVDYGNRPKGFDRRRPLYKLLSFFVLVVALRLPQALQRNIAQLRLLYFLNSCQILNNFQIMRTILIEKHIH